MSAAPLVAAVLVTHEADEFLEKTLDSIDAQSQPPDLRIAVDDLSTDSTVDVLVSRGFNTALATTSATDTITRIAQNFQQALRLAGEAGAEIVILGDHDDLWHRDRIEHQVDILVRQPHFAMIASDGFLIDDRGAAVSGTIRSHFPIPENFNDLKPRAQLAYSLRHSIATGGACAIRLSAMTDWSVPTGWLHDRWWSLATLRAHRFLADSTAVIDYRLSPDQEVGLDTADQQAPTRWLLGKVKNVRNVRSTIKRARDVSRLARG